MCIICDGASPDEARFSLHHAIETYGWAVVPVETKQRSHAWAYTIGLSDRFGHPELIVFALEPERAGALLNAVGNEIAGGDRFLPGDTIDCGPKLRFELVAVHPSHFETDRFACWVDYYDALGPPEPQAHALELVLPGRRPRLKMPGIRQQHLPGHVRGRHS